jgi:hypothetical protein
LREGKDVQPDPRCEDTFERSIDWVEFRVHADTVITHIDTHYHLVIRLKGSLRSLSITAPPSIVIDLRETSLGWSERLTD